MAETECSDDPEHAARVLAKALEALKTVTHFLSKPVLGLDAEQMEILKGRCRTLEAAIEQVSVQP